MAEEPIKYEDLPAEHKKKYDVLKAILEADLIGSFERTRSHGIKFKGFQPEAPTVDGITAIMRDQFGILPKKRMIGYSKSYPNEYDLIPLPPKYRLPDFTKFSGSGTSSIEHVRQRRGETVSEYIQRFRTVRNRCYSIRLSEKEAVELAIAGLSAPLKDVTFQADYNSLAHMVQKLISYEQRHPELYQDKFKRVALIEMEEDEDSVGNQEVAVAEWTRGAKPVSYKWVKQPGPTKGDAGLDRGLSSIGFSKEGFRPRSARMMKAEILVEVKKEIQKMLDAGSSAMQVYDGLEKVVFYLSRRMLDAETRYLEIEKLCLSLFFTCTKIQHILLKAEIIVICKSDVIKHMLSAPVLKGRLGKWMFALSEFDIRYQPAKAVKGQALADLIAERINTDVAALSVRAWTMFFDGSGMELLLDAGAEAVEIFGDSKLVISQLTEEYKCESESLFPLWMQCRELMAQFRYINFHWIPRTQNTEANDLAQTASGYKDVVEEADFQVQLMEPDDWRADIFNYLKDPARGAPKRIRYRAMKYVLIGDDMFYRTLEGLLLKCLGPAESNRLLHESIRSSPYYAQANGQAEASNKSLIKLIKRKIDENPRRWHEVLSEALWAYRMSCYGAIKTSPYHLVYGQEAVLPWEIKAGSRRVTFQNDLTTEEYAALMSDSIEDATELRLWSLEKIKENKAKVARAYNKKLKPKEFQVGDLVWEAVLPLGTKDKMSGKWSPNWHGPYKVDQVLKGNAYMLEQLDGVKFPVAVYGQHLKKYFPSMWDDE
ncbi:hypothetical protein QYE76_015677 [Lolium multiflorum]|uniref:RNase H type-1 domain-containing protein n=1 Tax=Lolium multiflorum TaxID=4521 RepID=A0AAD8U2Y1_LOLMU|nr:hypothetical protein QYE76_015677 [Lolium multiflorum]